MSTTLPVALIGCGRAGLVHARNLAGRTPGASLAAIADPSPEVREYATQTFGGITLFDDPVTAARDERFSAVVIGAPTFAHADVATAALERGAHVLCEKPLAANAQDAARIAAAAEVSSAVFMLGFMRRHDSGFQRAAERIAAGEIGDPVLVRSTGRGPGLPPAWAWDVERSGGLIAEVNSHDIDTVRWLSGQEVRRVHAVGRAAKRPDIQKEHPAFVDVVAANFELSEGALAQVDGACPADYGYDARVEVYGTEGVVFAGDALAGRELLVRSDGAVADPVRSWRTVFADAYRKEMDHFVNCATNGGTPVTDHTDGLRALEVVLAVNTSLSTGMPVDVTPIQGNGR